MEDRISQRDCITAPTAILWPLYKLNFEGLKR